MLGSGNYYEDPFLRTAYAKRAAVKRNARNKKGVSVNDIKKAKKAAAKSFKGNCPIPKKSTGFVQVKVQKQTSDYADVRSSPEYRAAMEAARERAGGKDEITGEVCELHGHHVKPVSKFPELACEPENIIMISSKVHLEYVHNGNLDVLKGMTEKQVALYKSLHYEARGVRAPVF